MESLGCIFYDDRFELPVAPLYSGGCAADIDFGRDGRGGTIFLSFPLPDGCNIPTASDYALGETAARSGTLPAELQCVY